MGKRGAGCDLGRSSSDDELSEIKNLGWVASRNVIFVNAGCLRVDDADFVLHVIKKQW